MKSLRHLASLASATFALVACSAGADWAGSQPTAYDVPPTSGDAPPGSCQVATGKWKTKTIKGDCKLDTCNIQQTGCKAQIQCASGAISFDATITGKSLALVGRNAKGEVGTCQGTFSGADSFGGTCEGGCVFEAKRDD